MTDLKLTISTDDRLNRITLYLSVLQEKVDKARNYYQQLLFRYTKETNAEDQSSRLNATLHRALKTVKDFGENIRGLPIMKSQPGGNLTI